MFCSKCGNQIMNEAIICPKCGCPTLNYNQSMYRRPNSQKPTISVNEAEIKLDKAQANTKVILLPLILWLIAFLAIQTIVDDYFPLVVIPVVISSIITIIVNIISVVSISSVSKIALLNQKKNDIVIKHVVVGIAALVLFISIIVIAVVKAF